MGNTLKTLKSIEKRKYNRVWNEIDGYRVNSPGLEISDKIIEFCADMGMKTVLDAGCGSGSASVAFKAAGLDVTAVDIALDAINPENIDALTGHVQEACLWDMKLKKKSDLVFCCDVMEHIPEAAVDATLENLARHTGQYAVFGISLVPDGFGREIGETLHETVKPLDWWLRKLRSHYLNTTVLSNPTTVAVILCEACCTNCKL